MASSLAYSHIPKIPAAITTQLGNELQAEVAALIDGNLDSFYPPAVLSYATSTRKNVDAVGTGPGMYFAKHVMEILLKADIESYSGLLVKPGQDWKVFMLRIKVNTPQLPNSRPLFFVRFHFICLEIDDHALL
jgi:hypothetical protein